MSENLEALILGIVQGITEFLPVSSSGHLEIMKFLLNDDSLAEQSMMTTVVLHFATALATMYVFREDIIKLLRGLFASGSDNSRNYFLYIVISMIPAVIVGLAFEDVIESFYHKKIGLVACMLLITGVLLLLSEKIKLPTKPLNGMRSAIVGVAQAIAILPGISRSGSTVATSLLLGVDRVEAARFSFLMVIPLIFGKMAKDLISGELISSMPSIAYLIIGFAAAFITGIFACKLMIKLVKNAKLEWFAVYCFLVGAGLLVYLNF